MQIGAGAIEAVKESTGDLTKAIKKSLKCGDAN